MCIVVPGPICRRGRHAQSAVLGQGGEPGHLDPRGALGRPLEDRRGAGVAERQRRELVAHDRADLLRGVATQMRDVLAAHTIPRLIRPWRIMSLRMKTPVIIPAHAFERSKLTRVPSADRLLQRHAHRRLELHAETPDMPA